VINNFKKAEQKLLQVNAAIWFNKWTSISTPVTGFNLGICTPWGWYIFTEICLSSVFTTYTMYLALWIWLILVNEYLKFLIPFEWDTQLYTYTEQQKM
jgi:hypothetical protein